MNLNSLVALMILLAVIAAYHFCYVQPAFQTLLKEIKRKRFKLSARNDINNEKLVQDAFTAALKDVLGPGTNGHKLDSPNSQKIEEVIQELYSSY